MEPITLNDIETQISRYEDACQESIDAQSKVLDLTDEVDQIKQDAEAYALETSASSTGRPSVKKKYLADHDRYNAAVTELKQSRIDLDRAECTKESARMKAWARIAILQNRDLKPSEEHTHPID